MGHKNKKAPKAQTEETINEVKTDNKFSKKIKSKRKVNSELTNEPPQKKQKKDKVLKPVEAQEELDPVRPKIKTQESKRSRKRKLHKNLMQEKKLKDEVKIQEKCLNYLSMWKHTKSQWKFQKTIQTWLFKNLYNEAKIPHEFWQTTLDYFNSSQGRIKNEMLVKAKKILDQQEEGVKDEEANSEDDDIKEEKLGEDLLFQRAKDIIQNILE